MLKRLLELIISLAVGVAFGFLFRLVYYANIQKIGQYIPASVPIVGGIVLGIIFFFTFAPFISDAILNKMEKAEANLSNMSLKELLASIFGIMAGLIIANLIGIPISKYGFIGSCIVVILNLVLGFLGYRVARRKKDEIGFDGIIQNSKIGKNNTYGKPKILDTSVIIDGRILDLLKTGFIEGKIIIPNFVLEELRHIADSSDSLKRNRGRRGLDILNEIQKQLTVSVEIVDFNCKERLEVDSKLLKMAQKMDAFVVTNDYNLNKVAEFQGVMVLNINELSNAIKPVVLPGEEMTVTIIKNGKENGQGVAYLNDGTMIVVDGGNKFIGETINVTVTSVLQTAAGRMIFGKKKD
ncbi:MAG: TRAM domain-containing protein [Clostridia bacterium]|nr:TRAM domain-containing protein [Clostridia bacterium]MCI2000130.1 TRAM domain-containing protein [Clostridia bacterium]MCI2014705.1 TRAM domain-containing protein [Clostridia bacterium]